MTASAVFTPDQMRRVDHHLRDLCREIEERCAAHRDIIGHALAVIARAAHPETESVVVSAVDTDGTFGSLLCAGGGRIEQLPHDVVSPELTNELVCMFRRLPHGKFGVWKRDPTTATLDVHAALTHGHRYPFLPVQDQLVAHIESKTGRSVRRIEIVSELFDNGYFFCDTAQVDYSDGDSDDVYVEDMADFAADLEQAIGNPGPHTVVTIACTSAGITID
ncbi:hypothetical protein [Rhodococcus sp. NCIMB 12038]|uniref:hypothetical protein n=1 Tax=Rhodococcus sp. NCIMB 12038 TaxID=933800 RepID=UPI000B3D05AA|nr:hypothetical protein [Rhodococcus sp. NCIMB 12038]OUS97253.1 hypothetical protein CA951_02590 [Rhodococcus sp. NCIMB 12038]